MFRNLVEFIEGKNLQPMVDDVTFALKDLKAVIEGLRKGGARLQDYSSFFRLQFITLDSHVAEMSNF